MIRIKDYIFNENDIKRITLVNNKKLIIKFSNEDAEIFEDTTFEDIEWNYQDKQIRKCLDSIDREEKLEDRINKALKYIGSITDVKVRYFDYRNFEKESLHISHEELKRRIKEQHLEGHFIEIDRNDILKILKGEVNE